MKSDPTVDLALDIKCPSFVVHSGVDKKKHLIAKYKVFRDALCTLILVGLASLLFASFPASAQSGDIWWDTSWNYRSQIVVESGQYLRTDKPVDIAIDFSQVLTDIGDSGEFDPATIRVVEVDASGTSVVDAGVPFQFDPSDDFDSASNATGRLVFLVNGTTADNTSRNYHVYFNQAGSGISEAIVCPCETR